MIVSIFKKVTDTTNPFNKSAIYCLERIRDGKSKELVEQIRACATKDEQKQYKNQLPGVCFNGTFKSRSVKGIEQRSGLMILDFDNMRLIDASCSRLCLLSLSSKFCRNRVGALE